MQGRQTQVVKPSFKHKKQLQMATASAQDVLRFIICGSVDDGKSTLIGRLLYESKKIFDDQLYALENDSKRFGTTGEKIDFALLVDGLAAEREQGITIDVAYRYFSTEKRKFIVADTPGHEQYTRNMATGASTAELAVVIVDARKGVLEQTRRHSMIVSMMGIRNVILAVNKMDMMEYDEAVFHNIVQDYMHSAASLGIENVTAIPISALQGDNVTKLSPKMPWYGAYVLLEALENAEIRKDVKDAPFRMAVQWVNRPHSDFRGYAGRIASGAAYPGMSVKIMPSGRQTTVTRIVTYDGDLPEAVAGQSITLKLADEVDISRGDVLCSAENPVPVADQFETKLVWFSDRPMVSSRQYILQAGTASLFCTPSKPKYIYDMETFECKAGKTLAMNDIGICEIALDRPLVFEPYQDNHVLGSFILIDRMTNETVAAGMINHSLRRATNVHMHASNVNKSSRSLVKGQQPCVLWMTGLSGSGKSTIANIVEAKLTAMGRHTMLLDGDNLRHGLNRDLGFTDQDRAENIRRVAEVSKLMTEAGLIVLAAFISPFRAERDMARQLIGTEEFIEIFVDTPLAVAEQRDVKGLYKKARAGEIPNFTGIGSPYEPPEKPTIHLQTEESDAEHLAEHVISFMEERGFLGDEG